MMFLCLTNILEKKISEVKTLQVTNFVILVYSFAFLSHWFRSTLLFFLIVVISDQILAFFCCHWSAFIFTVICKEAITYDLRPSIKRHWDYCWQQLYNSAGSPSTLNFIRSLLIGLSSVRELLKPCWTSATFLDGFLCLFCACCSPVWMTVPCKVN